MLDDPISAMEAEARIFDHFREAAKKQIAILIRHRFSTVFVVPASAGIKHHPSCFPPKGGQSHYIEPTVLSTDDEEATLERQH